MSPELLKKILAAIADGKDESGLLGEIVAAAAGGESAPAGEADPMAASAAPVPPPAGEEPKPAVAASVSALAKALGCATDEEAAQAVIKLQKQVQAQADATAAVEMGERRGLVARLVKCGVEKPAYAWAKNSKGEVTNTPAARLTVEPIAELRARVELHEAEAPRRAEAPETGILGDIASEVAKLSTDLLAQIKAKGMTPEQFITERRGVLKANK